MHDRHAILTDGEETRLMRVCHKHVNTLAQTLWKINCNLVIAINPDTWCWEFCIHRFTHIGVCLWRMKCVCVCVCV